jgi:hypothetical protein
MAVANHKGRHAHHQLDSPAPGPRAFLQRHGYGHVEQRQHGHEEPGTPAPIASPVPPPAVHPNKVTSPLPARIEMVREAPRHWPMAQRDTNTRGKCHKRPRPGLASSHRSPLGSGAGPCIHGGVVPCGKGGTKTECVVGSDRCKTRHRPHRDPTHIPRGFPSPGGCAVQPVPGGAPGCQGRSLWPPTIRKMRWHRPGSACSWTLHVARGRQRFR